LSVDGGPTGAHVGVADLSGVCSRLETSHGVGGVG
jgi:hypothetical protein